MDNEFVIIMSIRYMKPSLMAPAHDWAEKNVPKDVPGAHRHRSFHIAPDRGMSILYFKEKANLDAAFPMVKDVLNGMAERFDAKVESQKGITSPGMDWGD